MSPFGLAPLYSRSVLVTIDKNVGAVYVLRIKQEGYDKAADTPAQSKPCKGLRTR